MTHGPIKISQTWDHKWLKAKLCTLIVAAVLIFVLHIFLCYSVVWGGDFLRTVWYTFCCVRSPWCYVCYARAVTHWPPSHPMMHVHTRDISTNIKVKLSCYSHAFNTPGMYSTRRHKNAVMYGLYEGKSMDSVTDVLAVLQSWIFWYLHKICLHNKTGWQFFSQLAEFSHL